MVRTPTTLPTKPVISAQPPLPRPARAAPAVARAAPARARATPARARATPARARHGQRGTAGTSNAGRRARATPAGGHEQRQHGGHEQRRHGGHEQRRHGRCRDECRRPNSQQRSRCPRAERRRADHGAVPRRWQRSGVAGNECAGFERSTKHSGLPRPGWCARGHGRGVAAGRRRSPWDLGRQACRRTGDNHQQPTACLRSRRGNRPRGQG